ncbi:bacteriocin biosynthesis cyclodehydratase domain-containing protein [Kitasatospora sp. MAP12-15]|uniref:TOMM precursor leader peptide-binding protein n=1 Tax=unclassified Kitasatospora TaxID=2633591 RepID=UPI0024751164|nr:TOMM precursor leader peptide-binding protein [Kitasatospora sp. MAP12-44]MDH6110620.1 bacteriocin biosynthesis cyclodehydratase domain-containing protein [Kitasatospora sp. MAP12-44]
MIRTSERRGPLVGFKRHLRAHVVSPDNAYLVSDRGVTHLRGAHLETLAPLLDGTRDLSALVRETGSAMTTQQLGHLLGTLSEAGLVTYRPTEQPTSAGDRPAEAFWELAGLDGAHSAAQTTTGSVRIITLGSHSPAQVRAAMRAAGLTCAPAGAGVEDAVLTVVVCDDYLTPGLQQIDADQRAAGRPWLLAKPSGSTLWVGPVFQPGTSGCWSCLAHPLRANRLAEMTAAQESRSRCPEASLALTRDLGLQLVALEAVKWLAGYRHPGQQSVLTLDPLDVQGRHHTLVRRPQCPTCGDPAIGAAPTTRPVVLRSRPKTHQNGQGHRALTPQQVMERYGHLVSPVTGPVRDIRRHPHGPAFLNSFVAGHNPAAQQNGSAAGPVMRMFSGGKGTTELDARVGALCEALERHSGTFQGDEPRIRETLRGLGDAAIHPNSCQLYDERQYRDRKRWNAQHSGFQQVCDPLDEDTPIDWTPVWSLVTGDQRLLPTSMLYYDAPHEGPGRRYAVADSNGCAAGSSLEDAILQGFLELVERDAVAQWWYNRTRQPGVALAAFADPWIGELHQVHGKLNREVWALDLTCDLGIPVMAAFSRRTDKPQEDIIFGFGAHLDPKVALRRALTEMNQLLPAVVEVGPDGAGYAQGDPDALGWWRTATIANQPYLMGDPRQQCSRPDSHPWTARPDLRDDVEAACDLVSRNGMDLLVLDQTRPDIGLPVARVVVPGLRHFWTRFAPGRLFDVPVRTGRLDAPTRYEDLNPIPLFV